MRHTSSPGTAMSPSPNSENGKPDSARLGSTTVSQRGKRRRKGPVKESEVATVIITLSPNTAFDPNTQNTSYSSSPADSTAAVRYDCSPTSCSTSMVMKVAIRLFSVKLACPLCRSKVARYSPSRIAMPSAGHRSTSDRVSPVSLSMTPSHCGSWTFNLASPNGPPQRCSGKVIFPATAKVARIQKYHPSSVFRSRSGKYFSSA
mmetsp:Transcript_32173/g.70197  ORF Transcript_32173/g.70197 Transcript_32173/m.70197 type:complete len:204 (+) Transcript_32173:703-1314(+)